ncbi:MAG TPA: MBOAT family O-acyltransferase [Candidatus Methylacidiphilales bacterium]
MLFNSWGFILVFMPAVLAGFFLLPAQPHQARKCWLLAASLVFYGAWRIDYLPLLLGSVVYNFLIAEGLTLWRDTPKARNLLIVGVTGNLLLLAYYKYAGFFVGIVDAIFRQGFSLPQIILPLAISFFTFTQIAYIVDVYRDHTRHYGFLDYILFVTLFPHLIAGPIVRHWEIIPQYVDRDLRPSQTDLSVGAALFFLGLFKKCLIADPLAVTANAVFNSAASGTHILMFDAWFGSLSYTMQLYFDFSGYSDMAIGLARLLGIRFPCNFNSPYQATSIQDFWTRWHITLTRFIREYIYFPLGGNRCSPQRQVGNVMAVMLLCGLWHGAGWTFVLWGGLHGLYLLIGRLWALLGQKLKWTLNQWSLYRFATSGLTFLAVVLGWVLFRARDFPTAGEIYGAMFGHNGFTVPYEVGQASLGIGKLTSWLGGTIVPTNLAGISYRHSIAGLLAVLLLAWILPNTQQWLAKYEPILEQVRPRGFCQLTLNFPVGLAFGVGFFFVLRSYFSAQASPFLYFNF